MRNTIRILSLVIGFLISLDCIGQTVNPPNGPLDVFIDCWDCDLNYLREEVPIINYVRDKELAQVHVFVTEMRTGSGGRSYQFQFIGKKAFLGNNDTLEFNTPPASTMDYVRNGLKNTLLMGLLPYVGKTSSAGSLEIDVQAPGIEISKPEVEAGKDRWNYWVFEIQAGGQLEKESLQSEYSFESGFEARRITEEWKAEVDFGQHYRNRTYLEEGGDLNYISRDEWVNVDVVKSLGDHWSAGLNTDMRSSTYDNLKMKLGAKAAIEYSIYPYREVSRREITFAYHIGMDYQKYFEETIFLTEEDLLPVHELDFRLRYNQPWGYASLRIEGSQYLHDPSLFHVGLDGRLSWRIYKGLNIYMEVDYGIIRDQLYLAREEAGLDEILLRQKRIATDYELDFEFGVSYTFGSMYNNVVNTRL